MNFLPISQNTAPQAYREQNKPFFIDEAWVFLKNASIRSYIVEGLKTWGKHNAAFVLSTQSLDDPWKTHYKGLEADRV
jgi:type IV secretory pathway VirB4 component